VQVLVFFSEGERGRRGRAKGFGKKGLNEPSSSLARGRKEKGFAFRGLEEGKGTEKRSSFPSILLRNRGLEKEKKKKGKLRRGFDSKNGSQLGNIHFILIILFSRRNEERESSKGVLTPSLLVG